MVRSGAPSSSAAQGRDPRVDGILEVLANVGTLFEQQAQQQAVTGNGDHRVQGLIEQFLKLKPSKFAGVGDPNEAERWIRSLEKIFNLLTCTDTEKILLAEYQLEGNAEHWWRASKEVVFPTGTEIAWEKFVETFYEKYFSDCAKDQKIAEFIQLCQNNMTVDQYEAKFSELSRFAPRMVENREDKAKRFLNGLRTDIRRQLVPFDIRDYNVLYKRAQLIEQELTKGELEAMGQGKASHQATRDNVRFGKRPLQFGKPSFVHNKRRNNMRSWNNQSMEQRSFPNGNCRQCGRQHGNAPCPMLKRCFGCGQPGHVVKDCPQGRPQLSAPPARQLQRPTQGGVPPPRNLQRPPTQGKVYAITQEEAEASKTVISGYEIINIGM
ncbi:uncharacterized protein LOC115667572 [Syzygium oleosum]|uniref:uncharacterized protein LOC115667572 n=1 Tax=Syzygium oleosum TaxID=219896 RepID=UPI0024BAB846|nr:uncharacterized protein LOC115667572 [Syzygium oleosum]